MWFLDLLKTDNGWIKSDKVLPTNHFVRYISKGNNFIHCINKDRKHFKILIMNCLPKSLRNKYSKMYQDIINGYIKDIQHKY